VIFDNNDDENTLDRKRNESVLQEVNEQTGLIKEIR
jgi:hypothetical protein